MSQPNSNVNNGTNNNIQKPPVTPASTQGFWDTKKGQNTAGAIGAGINALSSVGNSLAGAHNQTGDTLNAVGDAAMMAPPPWGLIAGGVLKAAGFIVNGFTDSVNEQYVKQKNEEITSNATQLSLANSYEQLMQDQNSFKDVTLGDIDNWGSKGIFSSGKRRQAARDEAANYLAASNDARQRNLLNTAENIDVENTHNALLNITAKGGKIDKTPNVLLQNKQPLISEYSMKSSRKRKDKLTTKKNSYYETELTPEEYQRFIASGGEADVLEHDKPVIKEGDEFEFKDEQELKQWLAKNNLSMDNIQII